MKIIFSNQFGTKICPVDNTLKKKLDKNSNASLGAKICPVDNGVKEKIR